MFQATVCIYWKNRRRSDEKDNEGDSDHGRHSGSFTNFSSPEAFVLFGGLTKSGDLIMNPVKEAYDRNVLGIYKGKVKILISELKESDAAVLGASALGWEVKE